MKVIVPFADAGEVKTPLDPESKHLILFLFNIGLPAPALIIKSHLRQRQQRPQRQPTLSMATSNNTIPLAEPEFAEMRSVIFSPEAYTICPRCERDCTDTRINRVCVACERRFNEEMSRTKGGEKTRRYWRRMLKEAQEQQVRYRGCM